MTDKELLELAAKAAGCIYLTSGELYIEGEGNCEWNPLTDDGDALRLAVKLGIGAGVLLSLCASGPAVEVAGNESQWEKWGEDPYAATRRAIVKAAAEIGKGM
jgi:hypothetical protein